MILSTIMDKRIAKFQKRCGYKLKVNNDKYLIFESKDHFKKTGELERMAFDFVKHVLIGEDEYKDFVSLVHMLTTESYLISLPFSKIKIKLFDIFNDREDEVGYITPFESKFPTLDYFFKTLYLFDEEYSNYKLFMKKLKTDEVEEKFRHFKEEINKFVVLHVI